jgi:hypothetical protein
MTNGDRAMNARHMSSRAFTTLATTRGPGLPRTLSSPSLVVMNSDRAGLSAYGVILMPFGRCWVRLGLACGCARELPQLAGRMLWLIRNKLAGSNLRFRAARRG